MLRYWDSSTAGWFPLQADEVIFQKISRRKAGLSEPGTESVEYVADFKPEDIGVGFKGTGDAVTGGACLVEENVI